MFELLGQLLVLLAFLGLGYGFGHYREVKHLRYLDRMDEAFADMRTTNVQAEALLPGAKAIGLVSGTVVVATDYFKIFLSALRNLFGGELKSFETLVRRARREARVRMLTQAKAMGANAVVNIRFETSTVGGQQQKRVGGVEVIAYGTALIMPGREA